MQAIKEAGESGEDELQRRMMMFISPSAARAQDPSFIQVPHDCLPVLELRPVIITCQLSCKLTFRQSGRSQDMS